MLATAATLALLAGARAADQRPHSTVHQWREEAPLACSSDLDCSLNGVCSVGACQCDKPWTGPACGQLAYKSPSPAVAKDVFPLNRSHNTWNGPIIGPYNGTYHIILPYYGNYTGVKSLFRVDYVMHGVADRVEGPYRWGAEPNLRGGINPAALAFPNASDGGRTVYTVWDGGINASYSPYGPWRSIGGGCGTNSAPVYHDGAFYCTSQHTLEVFALPALGPRWAKYADINVTTGSGESVSYASLQPNVEDPFMWIDKRGNWHIINHRFWNETTNCGKSKVSAHTFSPDGKSWHVVTPDVEPYLHTVSWDDGTVHTYATLERPNLHFDPTGQLTHINLAADLVTTDAGCTNRGKPAACAYCKFLNHCGTIVVALDV